MFEFIATASAIEPYLKAYGTYKGAYSINKSLISIIKKKLPVKYRDISEILKDIQSENLKVGEIIETNGIMLEYGQIFNAYTRIDTMFGKCERAQNDRNFISDGTIYTQAAMGMEAKKFQPPVQKIPADKDFGCCFLYDSRFQGFEHSKDNENNRFIIDPYAKPIMLIYDKNKYSNCLNKEVSVRARIIELTPEFIANIFAVLDDTISDICSNFIDLYSESKNFICLTVADEETRITNPMEMESIINLSIPLYVECELENFDKLCENDNTKMTNLIAEIVPFLPQEIDVHFPAKILNTTSNTGNAFISTNDIFTVFREPNIIGFYTTTQMFNPIKSKECMESFSAVVKNFAVDYRNLTKKNFGKKERMCLNFLFDYLKQYTFDSRGVLTSNTAKAIVSDDESKKYIQSWLRNDRIEL